jgi:hypothetical protein
MSILLSVPLSKITRKRASVRPCALTEYLVHRRHRLSDRRHEPRAGADFRFQLEFARFHADPAFKVALHLLEQRLERLEILALVAVGDFLGGAFFRSAVRTWRRSVMSTKPAIAPAKLGQKRIVVHRRSG